MEQIEVLVVGAGPTGLMMAAELARHGVKPRIIDKAKQPSDKSKAIVIQARTLEIFDQIGILPSFLEQGIKIVAANPMSGGKPIAHIPFDTIESPFPFILSIEQTKTEKILNQHLESLGIYVERSIELTDFKDHGSHIDVTLNNNHKGQEEQVRAQWLIGCDGAHSLVRKGVDLQFGGRAIKDIFSLADVHIHWNHPHNELFLHLDQEGVVAAFPLPQKDHYRLVFQLKRCKHAINSPHLNPPSLEEVSEVINRVTKEEVKIDTPLWLTNFKINSRIAGRYRKNRIFLAGDAAHIHSPVGGQGMNTGIQDSHNLAWKLAYVQHGYAHKRLLKTYNDERHAFGKRLLRGTEIGTYIATLSNRFFIYLRDQIAHWLLKHTFIQEKFAQTISQTAIHYSMPSHFSEGNFIAKYAPGSRALCAVEKGCKAWQVLFWGGSSPNLPFSEEECICKGMSDEERKEYGIVHSGAYIIRPDNTISYRCTPMNEHEIIKHLKQYIKVQTSAKELKKSSNS